MSKTKKEALGVFIMTYVIAALLFGVFAGIVADKGDLTACAIGLCMMVWILFKLGILILNDGN